MLCDLLSGQFTGADDLVAKSGKAEFKRAAILVQQHASNVKAAFCLFLRQALPEVLGELACAVCNEDHIRVFKSIFLHQAQGLLERSCVIRTSVQKQLCGAEYIFSIILLRDKKIRLKMAFA